MANRLLVLSFFLCGVGVLAISGCTQRKTGQGEEGKILLRYANGSHLAYNKFRETEAKKFEKFYPNVIVKYEPIEGEYWTKILTMIAGGTVPDVFRNHDVISLAKKGAILDLTPYIEKDKEYFDQIYPQLIEFHRYKGKIYGLPSNLNVNVLFYNKKLFDEVGLAYPDENWTWNIMVEAAKKLTKKDARGITTQYGVIYGGIWPCFRQNGGRIWNENKTECIINSPENIEVLHLYKDLTHKHRVSPKRGEMREFGTYDMFMTGRLGMIIGGRWFTALFNLKKDLNWGIAHLPKLKNRDGYAHFNTLSISSTTKHPELAYELVKFLIRPDAIKFLVDVGDSIPIRFSSEANEYLLHEPGRTEYENQVYLDTMKNAITEQWAFSPEVSYEMQRTIMDQELERFLIVEGITAEETLQSIQDKLNNLLEEAKKNLKKTKNGSI